MSYDTAIITTSEDKGKKIYRQKTYYTLTLIEDVIASNKEEADKMLLDEGGIDYQAINRELAHTTCNVDTFFIDADYDHAETIKCIGVVDEEGEVVDCDEE